MAKEFTEAEIDFEGLAKELSRLVPPKVTLQEILGRLRDTMLEQQAKGVTLKQMCGVLKARGINVSERRLRSVLETGRLGRGPQPSGLSTASPETEQSQDEF